MMGLLLSLLALGLAALPVVALVLAARNTGELRRIGDRLRRLEDAFAERSAVEAIRSREAKAPPPAAPRAAAEARSKPSASAPPPPVEEPPAEPPTVEPPPVEPPTVSAAAEDIPLFEPPAGAAPRPAPGRGWSARELEERLGARLPVWIGAIALTLAAAFLVKLSFDRGWLGPAVRVALGALFGVVLLGGGEWLRKSAGRVSQGLSAAGVAVLFVAFYAGVSLYGLIPPAIGFALMTLTTAVAVVLSLRQGPMVAVLGLVGGLASPWLVSVGDPDVRLLFLYLLLLQAGILAVSERRSWWPLSGLSFVGGLAWLGLWLAGEFRATDVRWLGLFVLASVALFFVAGARGARTADADERHWIASLDWFVALGGFAALAVLTVRADFGPLGWGFLGLLGAGILVLARLRPAFHALAWLVAAATALLLAIWLAGLGTEPGPATRFVQTAATLGALYAVGGWAAMWGSNAMGRFGFLAAGSGIVYLLLAYWGSQPLELPWGGICLGLAALYVLGSLPVAKRRRPRGAESTRGAETESALAALAVAVTTLVSLSVPMELDEQWLTVAWALETAALVWLASRLRVPVLEKLAWVMGAAVAFRLLLNPWVLEYPLGEHPLLNWLLYGYGVPIAAFSLAAWLARRQANLPLARALEWGALTLSAMLLLLLVRQYFHPGELAQPSVSTLEWGTLVVVWLAFSRILLGWHRRLPLASLALFPRGLACLAMAVGLLLPGFLSNPIWRHEAVGSWPLVNTLLWIYGVPALLLVSLGRELRRLAAPRWLSTALHFGALVLVFLLVSLEVRQAFRGTYLDAGSASAAEGYAYSAAWIALGLVLLGAGIAAKGRWVRLSALVVMLLAVAKVFLYDMAELGGFYRVFSFLGLGASLLLIAWLYQRFVLRAAETADAS